MENKPSALLNLKILFGVVYYVTCTVKISSYSGVIMFIPLVLMVVVDSFQHHGGIRLYYTKPHTYIILLVAFSFISSAWAEHPDASIENGISMLKILIATLIVYAVFINEENPVDCMLKVIMWGGYALLLYSFIFYGFSTVILMISESARISNAAVNANQLGMSAAFSLIITIYYLIYDKFRLWMVFAVPCLIGIGLAASRKAILILIVGVILLGFFKTMESGSILKKFFRLLLAIVTIYLFLKVILQLPIFDTVNYRLETMLNGFLGRSGYVDYSTRIRESLSELGLQLFKEHPWTGVGIDNAGYYGGLLVGKEYYYLHNNYIEILADGGIIWFILYYSIYATILVSLLKKRDFQNKEFCICFILLILRLILDYGMVSYNYKNTYLYLVLFYFIKLRSDERIRSNGIKKVYKTSF